MFHLGVPALTSACLSSFHRPVTPVSHLPTPRYPLGPTRRRTPKGRQSSPKGIPFSSRDTVKDITPGGLDGDCAGRKRSFNGCGQVCFVAEEETIVLKNCILPRYLANYLG